jgi:hypothetical protein
MRVLFVAVGGNRKIAVTEESRRLAEAGGHAVVLVERADAWPVNGFAPRVEVAALARTGILVRMVRKVRHRLGRPMTPDRQYDRLVRRYRRFDALVITDPLSFTAAERLLARLGEDTRIAFRLDQLLQERA